jgi:hypothetical protein
MLSTTGKYNMFFSLDTSQVKQRIHGHVTLFRGRKGYRDSTYSKLLPVPSELSSAPRAIIAKIYAVNNNERLFRCLPNDHAVR